MINQDSDHEKFSDKSDDAYDSDDEKSHENRSKFRNDPEKMKILREKTFGKALIEEEHEASEELQLKRETRGNQVIDTVLHMVEVGHAEKPVPPTVEVDDIEKPELPTVEVGDFEKLVSPTDEAGDDQNEQIEELEFVNPFTLRRDVRFASSANNNIATDFRDVLQDVEYFMFERTCFGIYLNIPDCSHQGHIHRCIREFQVFHPYDDQLWISVHGKLLKFTLYEFAFITGLKCTGNEEDFDFTGEPTCRLITRYFRDRASITKSLLLDVFDNRRWLDNHDDAVKIAILVFITTFVLSQTVDSVIPLKYFHLVENGSYANYPWGKVAFKELMRCYNKVLDPGAKCNRLNGMPYALQVWIYECCNQVPEKLAVRENNLIPRILNWRVVTKKLQYKDAKAGLFGQCVFENIAPTVNELAWLSRPTAPSRVDTVSFEPGQVVSASTEHVSTSEPGQVVPASTEPGSTSEASVGFEDFTSPPTPIFFHRPASEGGTSSEPPKKKRKTIPIQKKVTRNQTRRPKVSLQSPKDQPIPESPEDVDHMEYQHLDDVSTDTDPVEHSQSESQNDDDSRGTTDAASNHPTERPLWKTVKVEEYVAPVEDVNPRTAEVILHSPLPVLSANKAQESTSVPSQELKQSINIEDVESTSHTIQSFLKSLPEKYSSPQTSIQSNSTSSTQTLAKLVFECSIRLPLEALALDPMTEKEMCSAIAALNENPSSLFSDEQAKQLVKLKYELPVMVSKWRHLAQAESRYQEFLTSFEEDREKLNDWSRRDETLKSEYAKREEQARELEAILQTIRTRQKEIMEERHEASHEAQQLMLLVKEKVGKTESTSTELETTKMQMNGLRRNWSNFQSKFP